MVMWSGRDSLLNNIWTYKEKAQTHEKGDSERNICDCFYTWNLFAVSTSWSKQADALFVLRRKHAEAVCRDDSLAVIVSHYLQCLQIVIMKLSLSIYPNASAFREIHGKCGQHWLGRMRSLESDLANVQISGLLLLYGKDLHWLCLERGIKIWKTRLLISVKFCRNSRSLDADNQTQN